MSDTPSTAPAPSSSAEPGHQPLSLVVTTLNNAQTLRRCLQSAAFADELLLVDSGSSDDTLAIAAEFGCRVLHKPFAGYGPQKQWAIEQAQHRYVLLLDADEWLPEDCRCEIQGLLAGMAAGQPTLAGYRLPRRELIFWQYQHPGARLNRYLRLLDRNRFRMSASTVHAAPEVDGPVGVLRCAFHHDGEPDIHTKVAKINAYSSGLVADKLERQVGFVRTRMLLYPPWFFVRQYLGKRQFLDGWAGFVQSVVGAFYVFLKYAKVYEVRRRNRR
jgi:glycosyltransferase involved in cell wall biosynthesis